MKKAYMPRIIDANIDFALKTKGAILIKGPKWCGKSRTGEQHAKSVIYMQNSETAETNIALAKLSPSKFLSKEKPLLIDEWQIIPFIYDSIRFQIDQNDEFGQFILTGSTTPIKDKNRHTGTGRIVTKRMRTMSLYESKDSSGYVSLRDLEKGIDILPDTCNKSLEDYAFYICRGGWPLAINDDKEIALQQAKDYYDGLVSEDIFRVPNITIRKNERRARALMRSYSRGISSQMTLNEIKKDIEANDDSIDEDTIKNYLQALEELFVIEELEAWNPNLRSKTAIRTKNTRHFVDPSIATSALAIAPDDLFKDLNTFGLLFESLAIRDLRVYCDSINAKIYHYRDNRDREIDAVIHFEDGNWAAIEIKLGNQEEIDKACTKLKDLIADINLPKPKFCAIITASKLIEKRKDGIYVIPLAALKN